MFRDTIALLLLLGWVAVLPSCTNRNSASEREIAGKSPNSPLGATKDAPKDNKAPVPGDLEKLEQSFVLAIKAKDTEVFLRLVSDGGMYLGAMPRSHPKRQSQIRLGRGRRFIVCYLNQHASELRQGVTHAPTASFFRMATKSTRAQAWATLTTAHRLNSL